MCDDIFQKKSLKFGKIGFGYKRTTIFVHDLVLATEKKNTHNITNTQFDQTFISNVFILIGLKISHSPSMRTSDWHLAIRNASGKIRRSTVSTEGVVTRQDDNISLSHF
jgi:hypothetical protein